MNTLTILLLIVVLIGGYIAYTKFFAPKKVKSDNSDTESESDEEPSEEVEKKEFTFEELAKHTTKSSRIYVSLKGTVYDVTDSGFYGPNEQYHIFAGKDASYNLAKMSFDTATLNKIDLSDLKRSEKETLDGYVELYDMKYPEVGWLREWKKSE
jgi:membrane-associated progesterone receptor component